MTKTALRNLILSLECRCGNTKRAGMAFCRGCWDTLPPGRMHTDLYKLIGVGFGEAYQRACEYLDADKISPRVIGKVL